MYVHSDLRGDKAKDFAAAPKPLGMGLAPDVASKVSRVLWIASSFTDPGGDWNKLTAFDERGRQLATVNQEGY